MSSPAEPVVGRLRRARGDHETVVRWLNLLAPVLLVAFLVAAAFGGPRPGPHGAGPVVLAAMVAFPVAVLGRNATTPAPRGIHLAWVLLALAASVTLMAVQPAGPGAAAVLAAVLFVTRLLPGRAVIPAMVVSFVAVVMISWATGRTDLATLAALCGLYGLLLMAFRLKEANSRAETLLAELRETQEMRARAAGLAERQRLAREMHDVLAHSLSGLILQLEGARMLAASTPCDPRLAEVVERAHGLSRAGLAEARRAIGTLRDEELPGPERLAGLAERFGRDTGVPCRLTVTGPARELDAEARLAVYRVAQEALTNITRHARAERVELTLAYAAETTRLVVRDRSERPADPATRGGTGGYGLTGMRERAELLGGSLVARATDDGFRIELEVPA
jgi:signal transduction histidine kinase